MRLLFLLLPILTWIQVGFAQKPDALSVFATLPQCAQLCLATALGNSSCTLSEPQCMCNNAELQSETEACVRKSCTLRKALTTKNVTATFCETPIRNGSNKIRITNIVTGVVSNACNLLRMSEKILSVGFSGLGMDDYSIMGTAALGVPLIVIIDRGIVPNGLAMDVWVVPFHHITEFLRWLYFLELFYTILIATVKLALLFFFLRIFPKRNIRRMLWATVAFDVLYGTAFVITSIFQCKPISFYWTHWDGEGTGQCVNLNAFFWSNAIISIVLDIWMLALPLYQVFHLQLSWRNKINVGMMFFVGTFFTVVSVLRLQSLIDFGVSLNPTWDQADVIYWSCIEINVGIICACMPSLRVIFVRMFPKMFASSREATVNLRKYGGRSEGMGGASAVRCGPEKAKNAHNITYTQTFDIQYADGDETSLVHMDDFNSKRRKPESSNGSEASL